MRFIKQLVCYILEDRYSGLFFMYKMRKQILIAICSVILAFESFVGSSITAYGAGIGVTVAKKVAEMTDEEIQSALTLWLPAWIYHGVGIAVDYENFTVSEFFRWFEELLDAKENLDSSESVEDFIRRTARMNDDGTFELSDELVDILYQIVNLHIQENCGWYEMKTLDYRDVSATSFTTQGLYNAFVSYCTQNLKGTDNVIFAKNEVKASSNGATIYYIPTTEALSGVEYYQNVVSGSECLAYITQEWSTVSVSFKRLTESGFTDAQHSLSNTTFLNATGLYSLDGRGIPITDGSRTVRVYKSLEELKSYSVGQRPYFVTDKFLNYDISGDNSCILSESDLSNGSVYGDVYNYIMDNYDNPNNLTEDQLTIIVENYINGSGGGSVSGNGTGSSGNGLSDFLGGLGSIGDAILSILGKLLEYVGKALDLVSGTVTKVLDIVPKNITALLSALFPFFPEEWLLAIELGLVLSVIVGIVGIFKK